MLSPARSLLALSLAALASGCAIAPRNDCPQLKGPAWQELRSEHFQLRTDLDPKDAQAALVRFEQFRSALLNAWGAGYRPPGVVDVVVFAKPSELEAIYGRDEHGQVIWGSGSHTGTGLRMVLSGKGGSILGGTGYKDVAPMYLMAWELTRQAMPSAPTWVREGFATYLETANIDDTETKTILGKPYRNKLYYLAQHSRLTLEQLWDYEKYPDEQAEASAWLWTHYLLAAHGDRFADFQARLTRGEPARPAFQKAFAGVDWDREQLEIHAYLREQHFRVYQYALATPAVTPQVRVLEDGEVHALKAELWEGGRRSEAQKKAEVAEQLRQAQAHDPAGVGTRLMLAQRLTGADERLVAARQLAHDFPQSLAAWKFLDAELPHGDATREERGEALTRALALAPSDPEVLNAYAWHFAWGETAQRAYEAARQARLMMPYSANTLDTYALAAAAVGRCNEALSVQRVAVSLVDSAGPEMLKRLRRYEGGCKEH
ncbi:hypothetical protein FGE12_21500 [Aggregicoccus sp. 17bor-14]|uniref:hypothetical protein n=1 Tax=Myxococcaceae TaxID=31 RepID=UPI00129C55E7|nr:MULTISPECIES: hypothetical protein [Myxococcaceae]MBF5044992.1 hypothetical protein [Simulacricoccus sp. 17bor-14]MRI90735.1 hypothetical protein [Aggregicoccus sp. 17bor-14]